MKFPWLYGEGKGSLCLSGWERGNVIKVVQD